MQPLRVRHSFRLLRRRLIGIIGAISFTAFALFGLGSAPLLSAQSSASNWQSAAGGKLSFDVVSVKQTVLDEPTRSNIPLGSGDSYSPTGGLFSATNVQLSVLIGFAYKLTPGQSQSLGSQLSKWASARRFDVQARGPESATKDQMRLMMQSVLADRFKLKVHNEDRQLPIFALVLVKGDKLGPQLRQHAADSEPCAPFATSAASTIPGGFPASCGVFLTHFDAGRMRTSARNVTINQISSALTASPFNVDRPVIDYTGLKGAFDFSIEFAPDAPIKLNGGNAPIDESAPTFLEALKEQLGLRLDSRTGPVTVLVIDHVEEPSEN